MGLTTVIIVIIIVSFACSPSVQCAQFECGSINVCGSSASCGTCDTDGWTCVDHVCNCTYPTSCVGECGTFTNNCGDVLTCGTCPQGVPCVDNLCIMNPWIVPLTDLFWVDSSADRVFPSGSFTTAMLSLKNANQSIADNITRESGATTTGYVASYDFGGTLQWASTLTNNASVGFAVSTARDGAADLRRLNPLAPDASAKQVERPAHWGFLPQPSLPNASMAPCKSPLPLLQDALSELPTSSPAFSPRRSETKLGRSGCTSRPRR